MIFTTPENEKHLQGRERKAMKKVTLVRFMVFICLTGGFLLAYSHPQQAPSSPAMTAQDKKIVEFAQKSLAAYVADIINEKNFIRFGFKDYAETRIVGLGAPYRVLIIGLESLKGYKAEAGVKSVAKDVGMYWFPVMVKDEMRTKLEIIEKGGRLIRGEFGRIAIVGKIASVKKRIPELMKSRDIEANANSSLINIPAMRITLFYIDSSKGEFLVPAMIQPQRYKIQNGTLYEAEQLLQTLKVFADKIDGKKLM